MLKHAVTIVSLTLFSFSAQAYQYSAKPKQASEYYAGLKVGNTFSHTLTCKRAEIANPNNYGAYIGSFKPNNIGYELEFLQNEKATIKTVVGQVAYGKYTGNKLAGYVTYNYVPRNSDLYIRSKVGLAYVHADIEANNIDKDETRTTDKVGMGMGMGVGYRLIDNLDAIIDYNYTNANEQFHDIGVGVNLRF